MQTHTKIHLTKLIFVLIFGICISPASAQEIWGMTRYGGKYDKGVIFKMDENASGQEVVFSFETIRHPEGGLTEYKNGVFYGLSRWGGRHNFGVIYRFDAGNGSFIKVLDLDGENTGKEGISRMLLASNDKMYGTTFRGGAHDKGILFEFDPLAEAVKKIMDYDGLETGGTPVGNLIEGADGKLYGTTASGGDNDVGVLFSCDLTTGEYRKLFDFDRIASGASPVGSLIQLADGVIYGLTTYGGASDDGTLFSFDPAAVKFTLLTEFDGEVTGSHPVAGLVSTPDGKLYGIAPDEGNAGMGVLFEYMPQSSSFSKELEFSVGEEAGWSCIAADNGLLYWLPDPGLHGAPWIMGYDPENNIYHRGTGASDYPRESGMFLNSLIETRDNKFFFIVNSTQNDVRNENNLYEYDPVKDEFTNHYRFSGIETGESPYGSLYEASTGMLYGTTYIGGAFHNGVIFKIDPETNSFTKIEDFERESKGANPKGGVVQAGNGKLYGLTSEGGLHDMGVLYELDPETESLTKIMDFDGVNGEHPDGELVLAPGGTLYGVTAGGGTYGDGVLFAFDPESVGYEKIIDFQGAQSGKGPVSNALVAASDGMLYGTTITGGEYDKGVLFEYNPESESFRKLIEYQETGTGNVPINLIQGADGKLYAHEAPGSIAAIDPETFASTKSLYDVHYLDQIAGRLLQAENGKFYGMDRGFIWYRATDFNGGIHEYDLDNGYNLVLEFNWTNGSNPENTSLIQLGKASAPVVQCKNISIHLDENGLAGLQPADVYDGTIGEGIELILSRSSFTCDNTGQNTVVLTATGMDGKSTTCSAVVTVADTIPPEAVCRDTIVFLDSDGNAVIEANDLDKGSGDACGVAEIALDVYAFTCENIGENLVELTVTDSNENVSTCTARVTVSDSIPPVAVCRNVEIYLDDEGNASVSAADVDNGSSDACGIDLVALNITGFTCGDLGENPTELTVTDSNGNTSTCTSVVTVTDTLSPALTCGSSFSQHLDPYKEKFQVEGAVWDAEAADNCLVESLEFFVNGDENPVGTSLAGFELAAGLYTIDWVAADGSGNFSSCNKTVSIEKRPTKLVIVENTVNRELEEIQVKALLTDDILGKGIAGKVVGLSVNDDSAAFITSDAGAVTFKVSYGNMLQELYSVSAWFEEDATYTASRSESGIVTQTEALAAAEIKVYPNPFFEKLCIEFVAPQSVDARIDLFDSSGRLVTTILNQPVEAGNYYKTEYLPSLSNSSLLLYRLKIGNAVQTGKVIYRQ